jgi:Ca2+-transporting ATPase
MSFGFDSFLKRAAIIRKHKKQSDFICKRFIRISIRCINKIIVNENVKELNDLEKASIITMSAAFAENALRIIAIAYKDLTPKPGYTIEDAAQALTFAGFVTMLDPPHEEVEKCH